MKRRHFTALALSAVGAGLQTAAMAAGYPSKPVTIVVPFPPGGANDLIARSLGQAMGPLLHGSLIVDNRSGGAAGSVGAQMVANAPTDGYTLLLGNTASLAINASVYPALRYDPQRDFDPVTVIGLSSLVLVVPSQVPARNIAEFVRLLKAAPGKHAYASAGAGSPLHLAGEMFKQRTGTDWLHVPYRGTAPAYTDLLSGRVTAMFDNTTTALPHVQAGSIRALAVTGKRRSPLFPDVPTLAEAGIADMEIPVWFGLVAPRGTSAAVVDQLSRAAVGAVRGEEMQQRLRDLDVEAWANSPADARAFIASENRKWKDVVQKANIKLD